MQINILGRINNVNLPFTKSLFPLFEAVINSIHAIEESKIQNGEITIYVGRDDSQGVLDNSDYEQNPIESFKVIDNGIGFDENNYNSFLTADSTYKSSKGAKGVGRFVWLKAFNNVTIKSIFSQNSIKYKREFNFVLTESGIENHNLTEISDAKNQTTVELLDFNEEYKIACPKTTKTICKRLIEHSLVYFLNQNCPKIHLIDNNERFDLNQIYKEHFKAFSKDEVIKIKSNQFSITHLRLYGSEENNHLIHYCAHSRDVKHENLSKHLPDLSRKIKDNDLKSFVYASYVSSD